MVSITIYSDFGAQKTQKTSNSQRNLKKDKMELEESGSLISD